MNLSQKKYKVLNVFDNKKMLTKTPLPLIKMNDFIL